jgi:transposase
VCAFIWVFSNMDDAVREQHFELDRTGDRLVQADHSSHPAAAPFADKGLGAEGKRDLCRSFGVELCVGKRHQMHGSGLGRRRWPVERASALACPANLLLRRATAGSASPSRPCSRPQTSF